MNQHSGESPISARCGDGSRTAPREAGSPGVAIARRYPLCLWYLAAIEREPIVRAFKPYSPYTRPCTFPPNFPRCEVNHGHRQGAE